jgi:exosortase
VLSGTKRFLFFSIALLIVSAVLARHALISTLTLAATDDQYTHILLIFPVTIAFVFIERKSVRNLGLSDSFYGIGLLGGAAVIAILSRILAMKMTADMLLAMEMLALITWWIGSFVLCFGTKVSRFLVFPLCFLYWMVPVPAIALNEIVSYLQEGSAVASKTLFALAGVPVLQKGLQLTIPGLTVEIAKECSSIRSSLFLLVTTMVLAHLFLSSPWRKTLVIAIAVPLSVAKNGLRIFTIAMLGMRVDPGYLTGRFHHQGGIVFFLIAFLMIFLLLKILERGEKHVAQRGT